MKRANVYETTRVLIAFIMPGYNKISQVPHLTHHVLHPWPSLFWPSLFWLSFARGAPAHSGPFMHGCCRRL